VKRNYYIAVNDICAHRKLYFDVHVFKCGFEVTEFINIKHIQLN